ncbi:ABC transporter ATP-binding protein [Gordonia rhizosphera]|uniref:Putative ABC transporter ATP-binding protein n=1 Tax=Gordonia rhizosphera NBRC 16068 TaxID=1108045 RepID=K6VQE6_9ACTN|nr:ABC transporter ATP-binding protein [Gordonia rhizosphera]GAB89135.1 putative ABC transporter ATP-binding protein [Gordonia rhizosphera NBRC 16068]
MTTVHEPVIEISGLRKKFGSFVALDGLDLTVRQGEVAGFLGPNGAGKSTTIRILLGMYRHDGGQATVFGADPMADAVAIHRRLAYVPGDVNLWPQLSGGECIDLLLSLRGVRRESATRKAELIERFELDPTKKASTYSKGNRQKVALVAALAAPCELLLLDEPTAGLDPLMTREFTECVRDVAATGAAVLLSSHLLAEVEALCESVTIIRAGKTVQAGSLADLRHLRRSRVTATIPTGASDLAAVGGVHDFVVDGSEVTFTVEDSGLPAVTQALARHDVRGLAVEPPSLEELFLHAYDNAAATS